MKEGKVVSIPYMCCHSAVLESILGTKEIHEDDFLNKRD
jgi:hypothetical protein